MKKEEKGVFRVVCAVFLDKESRLYLYCPNDMKHVHYTKACPECDNFEYISLWNTGHCLFYVVCNRNFKPYIVQTT